MSMGVTDLVALLELMMPAVKVNMEHHNGPRCQSRHQEPETLIMNYFIYTLQVGKEKYCIRYRAATSRSNVRFVLTLH